MRRRSLLLIISILTITIFVGCSTSTGTPVEKNPSVEETFTIGLEAGYAPFNWSQRDDSNGGIKLDKSTEYVGGYDIEIAKRIAKGIGKELVIVKIEWNDLIPALNSGEIDAIITGKSPTGESTESMDFSDNYYNSDLVMVVQAGGHYEGAASIQDFRGAKVTAQLNTFHYWLIDQIDGVIKEPAMDNIQAMRVALESGIIDGYISERPEGISASTTNENFEFVEFSDGFALSDSDKAIAVGVVKDSKLTLEINKVLGNITKEERQSIMDTAIINQPMRNK